MCFFLAVCPQGCINGGRCVSPGVCECRKGFVGTSCQEDIDECSFRIARCSGYATCVNTPGSYRCECTPGTQALYDHDTDPRCTDINECIGEGQGHDCAAGTTCRNTPGGYECICNGGYCDIPKAHCTFAGYLYPDGAKIGSIDSDRCSVCECNVSI